MSASIALRGVRCTLAGRTVLDIDRLVVGVGERVALVGHNSAGKSTLLRVLSGFTRPTAGQVSVLGVRLDTPLPPARLRALRCEAGQVLQGLHLVPRLSALENVLIGSLGRVTGWRSWVRRYPAHECEPHARRWRRWACWTRRRCEPTGCLAASDRRSRLRACWCRRRG